MGGPRNKGEGIRGTLPFSNSVPEKVLMALVNRLYQYTDSVEN
jgi:hypothetical protein